MRYLITLTFFLATTCTLAQLGPAGIYGAVENRFWFKADAMLPTLSDNNNMGSWTNFGGNGAPATATGGARPKYRTHVNYALNGYPVVNFNGNNDRLLLADTPDLNLEAVATARTYSLVFHTEIDIDTRQVLFEEGDGVRGFNIFIENSNVYVGIWNLSSDGAGAPFAFQNVSAAVSANSTYILTTTFEGNTNSTGNLSLWLNGELENTVSGVGFLYAHSGDIGIAAMVDGSNFFSAAAGGNDYFFDGNIAEFVVYNSALGTAGRIILDNYLSAKYDVALVAGDVFTMDDDTSGDYDHDAAGIGQSVPSDAFLNGRGSGLIGFTNPASIDDNTYLGWGHDNGTLTWNNTGLPAGIDGQLSRQWKTSQSGGAIGNIDISFDISGFEPTGSMNYRILADLNNNGDFSDDTPLPQLPGGSASNFTFSQVDLPPNTSFTLGYAFLLLPIELIGFQANPLGHQVRVKWSTASELNNDLFWVERSTDGEDWTELLYVDGAGNSQQQIDYETLDTTPLHGTSYYRLKQMDFSGASSYSDVVAVIMSGAPEASLEVWPNPTSEVLRVRTSGTTSNQMALYASDGKLVDYLKTTENEILELNVKHLPRGLYFIQFLAGTTPQHFKVILD